MSNNITITTQTYRGTFTKVNGESRSMRFVRISDLPTGTISEAAHQHIDNLQKLHGSEVVYDLDKQAFRVWKLIVHPQPSMLMQMKFHARV